MSDRKISAYFNTATPKSSKRQRSSSTPESTSPSFMELDKVGNLTQSQLMAGLSKLLDEKLVNVATKEDLLQLSNKIDVLQNENEELKNELCIMRNQESIMLARIVDLESRSRKNNLIFKGLKVPEGTTDYCHVVKKFCEEAFGSRDSLFVNRAHPLGRDRSTIIAHLPNDWDIQNIMSQTRSLKGTGYVVHRDHPQEIREKRAYLAKVRAEVERVMGRRKMPLVHDHLYIEGCRFTWEGELRAGGVNGGQRLKEVIGRDFSEFLDKLKRDPGDVRPPAMSAAGRGSSIRR